MFRQGALPARYFRMQSETLEQGWESYALNTVAPYDRLAQVVPINLASLIFFGGVLLQKGWYLSRFYIKFIFWY